MCIERCNVLHIWTHFIIPHVILSNMAKKVLLSMQNGPLKPGTQPFMHVPFTKWHCSSSTQFPHDSVQSLPKVPLSHSVKMHNKLNINMNREVPFSCNALHFSFSFIYLINNLLYKGSPCIPDHIHSYRFHRCNDMVCLQHTFHKVVYSLDQMFRFHTLSIVKIFMMCHYITHKWYYS